MRSTRLLAALAAAALAAGSPFHAPSALAQGNPSANDIINSLRPGSSMGAGTRGIGVVRPPASDAGGGGGSGSGSVAAPLSRPSAAAPRRNPGAAQPAVAQGGGQPAGQQSAPSVNLTVQFANNSAELTPAATRTLDELGQALSSQALSSFRFRIEGHTDAVGSRDHNQALSEQRAAKVVEYLAGKFNLDRSKLESVGMGPDQPLVPSAAGVSQPRNRRVTVVNLGT